MDTIFVIARLSIHAGKLAELKAIAARCIQVVKDREPGTKQYDWYYNADESKCVVLETYRDSAAVFDHIANLGENLAALQSVCDMAIELYGIPSAELAAATEAMGVQHFRPASR